MFNLSKIYPIPKSIVWGTIIAVITTVLGFSYNNASLPTDKKKIDIIQSEITNHNEKDNQRDITIEVMKNDMSNLKNDVSEIKSLLLNQKINK